MSACPTFFAFRPGPRSYSLLPWCQEPDDNNRGTCTFCLGFAVLRYPFPHTTSILLPQYLSHSFKFLEYPSFERELLDYPPNRELALQSKYLIMTSIAQNFESESQWKDTTHVQSEIDHPSTLISYLHELMRQVGTTSIHLHICEYRQAMRKCNLELICRDVLSYQERGDWPLLQCQQKLESIPHTVALSNMAVLLSRIALMEFQLKEWTARQRQIVCLRSLWRLDKR